MITVVTILFQPLKHTPNHSKVFSPEWVEKIYRGVNRHTTHEWEMVCLTDREYKFQMPIIQRPLPKDVVWASVLQEAYTVECERMCFMGLDTVICGSLNPLFNRVEKLIVPRDPNRPAHACSGFVLCDYMPEIATTRALNDMEALDKHNPVFWDDLCPGKVKSYKCHVKKEGIGDASVVYFHGKEKPHEIDHEIVNHWI